MTRRSPAIHRRGKRVPKRYIRTAADERAAAEGCHVDEAAADRVREFLKTFCRHFKGEWAGRPLVLDAWQYEDLILPIYGWQRPEGGRRFRIAWVEVAKKNGKSTLGAGLLLYMLVADGEPGAEIYVAAADRYQARNVFQPSCWMVSASPDLRIHLQVIESKNRIVFEETHSFAQALSADAYRNEGLNIHALFFDEVHAQPDRRLFDTLKYGGAARRQPLNLMLTTAGNDRNSLGFEQHKYAMAILKGEITDTRYFAYIRAADEKDIETNAWKRPKAWRKANPALGITLREADMAAEVETAEQSHAERSAFFRYRLNIWVQGEQRWIEAAAWAACGAPFDAATLEGKRCWGGLDLASTRDTNTLILLFPRPWEERPDVDFALLRWTWLPREEAERRELKDGIPWLDWSNRGLVTLTPGNVTDYNFIKEQIGKDIAPKYQIVDVGFDKYNATQLAIDLKEEHGIGMVVVGMGIETVNEPSKKFEWLVTSGRLAHGGDEVLAWMAGNVEIRQNEKNNIRPVKPSPNSPYKVDGIIATIIALARAGAQEQEVPSVYEERGPLVLKF